MFRQILAAFVIAAANAVRLSQHHHAEDDYAYGVGLQADLSLPLSVQLGDAQFRTKTSECPETDQE